MMRIFNNAICDHRTAPDYQDRFRGEGLGLRAVRVCNDSALPQVASIDADTRLDTYDHLMVHAYFVY